MKYVFQIGVVLLLLAQCKSLQDHHVTEDFQTVVIVRNCSGTYVKIDEQDFQVCNAEALEKFDDGESVDIEYEDVEKCENKEGVAVCMLYHPHEGYVFVNQVKE